MDQNLKPGLPARALLSEETNARILEGLEEDPYSSCAEITILLVYFAVAKKGEPPLDGKFGAQTSLLLCCCATLSSYLISSTMRFVTSLQSCCIIAA